MACSTDSVWIRFGCLPARRSLYSGFWRMVLVWSVFTGISGYFMFLATRKKLDKRTPGRVYSFFFFAYKACYGTVRRLNALAPWRLCSFAVVLGLSGRVWVRHRAGHVHGTAPALPGVHVSSLSCSCVSLRR